MPITFAIKEKEYTYPEGWQDVTLKKWMQSLKVLKKPEVLTKFHSFKDAAKRQEYAAECIPDSVYKREIFPYFVEFFCFWSDCPKDAANLLKKTVFEQYYQQLESNFNRSLATCQEYTPTIEHRKQVWHLPKQHLQGDTVGAFIEAAHLEHQASELQNNQMEAIPEMLCIFLRKEGEAYNPEFIKRKPLFMTLPMDKVFQVSFFLLKLNEKYLQECLIYTAIKHLNQHPLNAAQA